MKKIIVPIAAALLLSVIAYSGVLKTPDRYVQDTMYQTGQALSGEIVVIGIDEKALTEIGAYNTWDRNIMAQALEALYSDPENKPAVVAIDTLYSGETDEAADAHLAEAAKALGNVITAGTAAFGSRLETDADGGRFINNYAIVQYEESYDALKNVTTVGHINAMYDTDGIMRHAVLYVEPDGKKIYSMAYETAKKYAEGKGIEINEPKTNVRGQFYVSFSAHPGDYYDSVSIADLINGRVPSDYYAGKIVFIGPYAAGLQDAYFTPIERSSQMYGVEFQANVVEQILSGDYKTEASDLLQAVALFILCTITGFLFYNKLKLRGSSILAAVLIIAGIGISILLYNAGYIIHPLWLPVAVLVLYIASIAVRYVQSLIEKQRVTRTFERYVAPDVVQEILKGGTDALQLGGRLCDIAVLFVDVRGFTTMSERLDPEKVVYILNKYLTVTAACIERNKGTLDKFVGDATMAFWGAPLPSEDPVYLAVKTAKEIVEGANSVSDELKEEIGEELHVGVGVHYGPAVVGNMGSERRMDFTAIGDTVNTSARLEANAPGGCVYISRAVADALGDRITYTSLGDTVKLKGKKEGFEVLLLESVK
ncbi:MAG: adenylate/guanylate cyclase domain-containing protein [Lachnospiraceae bacterium]|nr:adenylate/guanylate cyclase domain-containing protein [Lachnospiraceae bacterium]